MKEKLALSITTNSVNRRRSTMSSATDNSSMYNQQHLEERTTSPSHSRQNTISSHHSQTPGIGGVPVLPALPVMSPISRAFSIRTPVTENSPGLPPIAAFHSNAAFESATMSRAESLSRSLKMTLRKKSRKKSQSAGSVNTINPNTTTGSKP
jgi:hypothetical protein